MEGLHTFAHEHSGGYRLLPGRGVDVARAGDILRFVFHPLGLSPYLTAGITEHSDFAWMEQMARKVTAEGWGFLEGRRYLLHDGDARFSDSFRDTVMAGGTKPLKLPARSPKLNSFAERWVRSVKEECLSKLVRFSGGSLRGAVGEYLINAFPGGEEPPREGNVLLFPRSEVLIGVNKGTVRCKERLGSLLKYYRHEGA